jgi:hypothetical protein
VNALHWRHLWHPGGPGSFPGGRQESCGHPDVFMHIDAWGLRFLRRGRRGQPDDCGYQY